MTFPTRFHARAAPQVAAFAARAVRVAVHTRGRADVQECDADASEVLRLVRELAEALKSRASAAALGIPPTLGSALDTSAASATGAIAVAPLASARFPLFGSLVRSLHALDALAGGERVPPIVRPVQVWGLPHLRDLHSSPLLSLALHCSPSLSAALIRSPLLSLALP